jgi:broad specificity phosphatase PhoE
MSAGAESPREDARAAVYLARHGRTAYNNERRFQGRLPVPLDDVGLAQAHELATRAASHDFAVLWCSPLRRARETADIVAARVALEPREDERLVETDAGDWTDRTFAEVQAEAPREFARFAALDMGFAFPGGESFTDQAHRVHAAIADISGGEIPALVVCHGVVIRLALADYLPPEEPPPRIANAALIPLGGPAAHAETPGTVPAPAGSEPGGAGEPAEPPEPGAGSGDAAIGG